MYVTVIYFQQNSQDFCYLCFGQHDLFIKLILPSWIFADQVQFRTESGQTSRWQPWGLVLKYILGHESGIIYLLELIKCLVGISS